MKKRCPFTLFLSLILTRNILSLFSFFTAPHSYLLCGFTESLDHLGKIVTALTDFFSVIKSVLTITGVNTLVLLIMVTIFSAGLNVVGLPRGKTSFLISLAAADSLWFAWEKAMNTEPGVFFPAMLKSNTLLVLPLTIVAVITGIAPGIKKSVKKIPSLFSKKKNIPLSSQKAVETLITLDRHMNTLRGAYLNDIKKGGSASEVAVSPETEQAKQALKKELDKI